MYSVSRKFGRGLLLLNNLVVPSARRIAMCAAVVVIAGACAAVIPQAAFAGTNGQQIEFDLNHCGNGLGLVSVYGTNQYGQSMHWSGSASNDAVYVAGWWWVGNITVWYTQAGQLHYVHAYVPQGNDTSYQYWPNVVRVDCHGSWKLGSGRLAAGTGNVSWCASSDNWWGSYTRYFNFQGYWGIGWNGSTSPNGYGIAYAGTVPWLITVSYYSVQCD